MAAIDIIDPFPREVCDAFYAFIQAPSYVNRERIPYSKWVQMSVFLDQPDLKPENAADSNLKHQAKTEFELVNRQLYQRPKGKHSQSRYIVLESEAFDLIVNNTYSCYMLAETRHLWL
jgi:hypothetical protein